MKLSLIVIFIIVSVLNIYSQKVDDGKYVNEGSKLLIYIKNITKPLLLPLLLTIYLIFRNTQSSINFHLIIALIFGLIGDVALMIPIKGSEENMNSLMVGLFFFFCGHITYFMLFIKSSINLTNTNMIYLLIYLGYIGYSIGMYTYFIHNGLLNTRDKSNTLSHRLIILLRFFLVVYMIGFSLMSYSSLLRLINLRNVAALFTFIGSLVFISSDSVLGLIRFGQNKKLSEQYIMGSYILAQSLIVIGYII